MMTKDKTIQLIGGKMVLICTILFSSFVHGQTFCLSYTTYADSLHQVPLEAVIEYDITDPDSRSVAIKGFSGSFFDLALPETVVCDSLEYTVTEIADAAFASQDEMPDGQVCLGCLILPETISDIGDRAFQNAEFNIQMKDGVVVIGKGAFAGCKNLVMDKMPEKLEFIGSDAFRNSGLADTLFIHHSVLEIGAGAFAECEGLKAFSIHPGHLAFSVEDGVLYSDDGAHLIQYPGGKPDSCFVVPATVMDVEDAAFAGCHYLKSISFANECTSLWKEVFFNCKSLESATLPADLDQILDGMFSGCSQLKEIHIPDKVTAIGRQAFLDCSSLVCLTIPEEVLFLGERCFWGCDNIQWVKAFPYEPPMMDKEVFSKFDIPVYSHFTCLDSYRQDDQWSLFMAFRPITEIYVENLTVYPMGSRQFEVVLETAGLEGAAFDTIEFTISLPAGFSLATDTVSGTSWTIPEGQPNGRLNVDVDDVQDGKYHFVIKAEEGMNIMTGHYPILSLRLCANSFVEDVGLSASVTEVQAKAADILLADIPHSFFSVQVEKLLLGDVNFDSRQNVVDVMSIVSNILDSQYPIPLNVADVNQDSSVDIVDVMRLVQIILSND